MDSPNPSLDPITSRQEIVFLFDAVDSNPNGDPLTEENRPRIDDTSQQALVSDVRLKRTVRDYLEQQGYPIFIKAAGEEEDRRDDKNDRFNALEPLMRQHLSETLGVIDKPEAIGALDELTEEHVGHCDRSAEDIAEQAFLAVATDVRLFGDSMAFDYAVNADYLSSTYTGPIQFGFARSLNRVEPAHHGKTSVLSASSADQQNIGGNMYTEHRLPYALFAAHGVVNEHSAQDTKLSAEDVKAATEGLWEGTHRLNSHSKVGVEPRLLFRVKYTEDASHIGDLHREITLKQTPEESLEFRDPRDPTIQLDEFVSILAKHEADIAGLYGRISRQLQFEIDGVDSSPTEVEGPLTDTLGDEQVHLSVV